MIIADVPKILAKQQKHDEEFAEFLKGKSVAVCGRGNSLERCDGTYIDSFDVVVRIHGPIPGIKDEINWQPEPDFVPEAWHDRIGRKTDIFYHDLNGVSERRCHQVFDSFFEHGGKFVGVDFTNFNTHKHPQTHSYIENEICMVRKTNPSIYFYLHKHLGSRPMAGTEILVDIIMHDVSLVYICGMARIDHMPYNASYDKDSKNDDRFIHGLVIEHDNIIVDSVMEKVYEEYD